MATDAELDARALRRIIDQVPRAIAVTDGSGTIRLWSAGAEHILGWTEAEVLGTSILEILGSDDPERDGGEVLAALVEGREHRSDREVVRGDGSVVHLHTITSALRDADGEIELLVGVSDDLAEVAALERETRALTEHLRLALDAGGLGTWRWDLASGRTAWDAEMERLFGLEPGTFDGTFEAWASMIHPDQRDEALAVIEEAVAAKGHYRLEHRVITPAGDERWIEGAGRVILDEDGNVTGTIGCAFDITERAQTEQVRDRLNQLAVESLARERVLRERLELVAAVNEALVDADDLSALMRRVAEAVVPRLGDWCSLYVFESEHAAVPTVVTAHRDPAMVRYAEELQARFPYDPEAPSGVPAVVRTGRTEFYPSIDDEVIDASDATPEQRDVVRDLALRSAITVPLEKQGRSLGAMQFVMAEGHRAYTDEDVTLAEAMAARIAATLDNRRLRQQGARTARTDAALAGLGRRLAASASLDEVLAVIADGAPSVLDAERVDVALAADAESLVLVGAHQRVPLRDAGPLTEALTDAEIIVRERDGWGAILRLDRTDLDDAADGAVVASPLFDDVHHPMGVLVLVWDEPRSFDELDVNAVETLSRLCGQAIVRAQLAGHTEQLAVLAGAMAATRSTREVAELLREHGTTNLGATVANLRMVDRESSTLLPVIPSSVPPEIAARYERLPLRAAVPLTDAVRNDASVLLADLQQVDARYPDVAREAAAAGLGAMAVFPLHDSAGAVVGAVAFAWPAAMRFDERLRRRLATLCDLAAQTLERVRLSEAEHDVVASIQRRLIVPLPEVDGLEVAALYEPAAAAVGMGGDWYEAVAMPDGSLVAIVGDVVGHGVDAVAAMAQLQHLLTGLLRAGTPLRELLASASTMIAGPERTYATALLLHVDAAGGRVGYLSAGHPWALLRAPDGTVAALDANQDPMVGLDLEPRDLVYLPLLPGSLLLAYTDGLVERRGESIHDGIDRLAACLAEADDAPGGDIHAHLRDLVACVRDDDPARRANVDDIAAMLIRVADPAASPG